MQPHFAQGNESVPSRSGLTGWSSRHQQASLVGSLRASHSVRLTVSVRLFMSEANFKRLISENSAEIARLHSRIHETVRFRGRSEQDRKQWQDACAEFHARYDALAFPGGYEAALSGIAAGEPGAIEAAICFLELRPYFFRSGYMYKVLLRKVKRASLNSQQRHRVEAILNRQAKWRERKAADVGA